MEDKNLRDHFAGLAMQSILVNGFDKYFFTAPQDDRYLSIKNITEEAYFIADSMLAQRGE